MYHCCRQPCALLLNVMTATELRKDQRDMSRESYRNCKGEGWQEKKNAQKRKKKRQWKVSDSVES